MIPQVVDNWMDRVVAWVWSNYPVSLAIEGQSIRVMMMAEVNSQGFAAVPGAVGNRESVVAVVES